MRTNYSSGALWEDRVGYSRAVKVGNIIEVSGTTATEGSVIIGEGDIYQQTAFIFSKIKTVLAEAGASLHDVIRTRMYVTDISLWEQAGKAHVEVFQNIKPATSMVEVAGLIDPKLLIEIEVTAVIDNQ